jgi:phosphotransferase system enzyme I (PtsI)
MADGHPVQLWANIGHPDEAASARERGAEGVGLFRTEFLFLDRAIAPSEDEQYAAYAHTLEAMAGRPVVVRTLDVGGDKPIPYLPPLPESNPFLGTRGIRFARHAPQLFETQLRALLRAAPHGDLRIMLPMVATPDDVAWARAVLQRLAAELGVGAGSVPLGIMVETPAAAVSLDRLRPGLAFCSVGSNDLAQYTLAADRSSSTLATSYRHDDPAVFRLIRTAARAAHALGLEISVCGELAGDPHHALALVGLGIDKLSMAPAALDDVKELLLASTLDAARQQAGAACDDARG